MLDVINGDGDLRFQIRFHGDTIGQVFGSPDCRGRFLHENKPEPARSQALAPYRQAVATGRPVFTIHDLADARGGWCITSGCCCHSRATAKPSTAS